MNLLVLSDETSALLVAGMGLLASIVLAFGVYQKGLAGKRSLEQNTATVLSIDSVQKQEPRSQQAA